MALAHKENLLNLEFWSLIALFKWHRFWLHVGLILVGLEMFYNLTYLPEYWTNQFIYKDDCSLDRKIIIQLLWNFTNTELYQWIFSHPISAINHHLIICNVNILHTAWDQPQNYTCRFLWRSANNWFRWPSQFYDVIRKWEIIITRLIKHLPQNINSWVACSLIDYISKCPPAKIWICF